MAGFVGHVVRNRPVRGEIENLVGASAMEVNESTGMQPTESRDVNRRDWAVGSPS